ncbi:uncharacterized protein I303_103263 [Kwoniella dejecticola CBS 10117]|uniref:Uracil transporter FurD n=1 Tax=Kwoniella dejecticola CBS 10117 TaxID=1296121 RepID=A0A1A6AB11_9TREE|nr:uncharacterized protein I303_03286 [Kwoniella dejecticola CBS 10117]OBR87261.1 hypothetical protein I303_03286 [Kwoniella dejecticola CBS 10117]
MLGLTKLKQATQSKEAFIRFLEAPPPEGEDAANHDKRNLRWTNVDLAPSPPQDRKWTQWTFLAFWVAHAAGAGSWTAGSSLINVGLAPRDAYIAIATSHILITILIVLNGRGPARYHIGFPVFARTSYGMWGSYVAIMMRAIVCIIWNGTNSYYGGRCLTVAFTAIFPSYAKIPALPKSASISSPDLLSFFIFMFFFIGISFVHSRDLKWFYIGKSIFVFAAMHAILIWWVVKSHGVTFAYIAVDKPISSTAHIWLVLRAFNTGLGTASSLTVNQGDMARYADKPGSALWTTLIGYPIASALPCLYGILVAAAGRKITGTAFWNLWDVLAYMLEQYPDNHGARFGIFLCAVAVALSYLAVNLATNSLPFGSDVTAMFPRWMTIRRGQVICTILGIAIVPWKLLNNAAAFLTFLSGYGYWLSPIAAIMFVDYYLIKKGNIMINDLYDGSPSSRYWFSKGLNWRAVIVTVLALLPCLPSLAWSIAPKKVHISPSAQNLFYISFVMTWAIAGAMYYASYIIFPEKNLEIDEKSLAFEDMANELDRQEADAQTSWLERSSESEANEPPVESLGDKAVQVDTEKGQPQAYVVLAR